MIGFVVLIVGMGVFATLRKGTASNEVSPTLPDPKTERVQELEGIMAANPNKDSQEYQAARQEYCLLKSRPATEREQAVANVKKFLGMPDVPVEFTCGRGNSEYYTAAGFSLKVDPETNYIMEVGEAERRWGTKEDGTRWFDPMPEYDYTVRYTTPEAIKPVAEEFMRKHQDILGVDIDQMTYEFRGTKPGNFFLKWHDQDYPSVEEHEECGDVDPDAMPIENRSGAYQNDQGVWCIKSKVTRYPSVYMTITQGGQVIVYSKDS